MNFIYNDGGRRAAGRRGRSGDCVTRAIAIVTGLPYLEVYGRLAAGMGDQRRSKHQHGRNVRSASRGVNTSRKWFKDYMRELGFTWHPTMTIGSGCRVHLRSQELPPGRLVVAVSGHYTAVIDGVLHDNSDCSRGGTRCVYGYWRLEGHPTQGTTPDRRI